MIERLSHEDEEVAGWVVYDGADLDGPEALRALRQAAGLSMSGPGRAEYDVPDEVAAGQACHYPEATAIDKLARIIDSRIVSRISTARPPQADGVHSIPERKTVGYANEHDRTLRTRDRYAGSLIRSWL